MSHFDFKRSYRRNLPHIQPPGASLFVTFRLAGSLPQNVVAQWKEERKWLERLAKSNPSLAMSKTGDNGSGIFVGNANC